MTNAKNLMGTKPILPLLVSMSVPSILSMLIQSLYNVVDAYLWPGSAMMHLPRFLWLIPCKILCWQSLLALA